jgi:hypothetical protein
LIVIGQLSRTYRLLRLHVAGFVARTEAHTGVRIGSQLPQFIKEEFDAYLAFGILEHGFLRLRRGEFGQDKLQAGPRAERAHAKR